MTVATEANKTKTRVLVADDHPLIRQGLAQVLEMEEDIEIVGEASNGRECVEKARAVRPDVVLVDINMPLMNGLEASRALKEALPDVGVLILTIHDADEYLLEAVRSGVDGYVLKDVDPAVLVQAIRSIKAGRGYLHPSLGVRLMHGVRRQQGSRDERAEDVLTAREVEVLHLLAEGVSNRDIAERLFISEKTVKNHTNSIFRKMGVSDRTQAVLQAIKKGWVQVR